MKQNAYLILIPLFLLLLLNCQNEAGSSSSSSDETYSNTQGKVVIECTLERRAERIGTGRFADEPDPGYDYAIVNVDITNDGCPEFYVTPHRFTLFTGNVGYSSALVVHLENELRSVDIRDGGQVSGKIAFEIPENRHDMAISCDSWPGEYCEIDIGFR